MTRPWMSILGNVHSLTEKQHRFYSNHSQKLRKPIIIQMYLKLIHLVKDNIFTYCFR